MIYWHICFKELNIKVFFLYLFLNSLFFILFFLISGMLTDITIIFFFEYFLLVGWVWSFFSCYFASLLICDLEVISYERRGSIGMECYDDFSFWQFSHDMDYNLLEKELAYLRDMESFGDWAKLY